MDDTATSKRQSNDMSENLNDVSSDEHFEPLHRLRVTRSQTRSRRGVKTQSLCAPSELTALVEESTEDRSAFENAFDVDISQGVCHNRRGRGGKKAELKPCWDEEERNIMRALLSNNVSSIRDIIAVRFHTPYFFFARIA